jgi:hypothetical protein
MASPPQQSLFRPSGVDCEPDPVLGCGRIASRHSGLNPAHQDQLPNRDLQPVARTAKIKTVLN